MNLGVGPGSAPAFNTILGVSANGLKTSGGWSTAIGYQALRGDVNGNFNTAVGSSALTSGGGGSHNTSLGFYALGASTSGSNNVAIGSQAGSSVVSSSNSIYVGYNAYPLATGQTNQIVIGTSTTGLGSNTTVIGNSSTTDTAIYGRMLVNYSSPVIGTHALDVNGTARVSGGLTISAAFGLNLSAAASYLSFNSTTLLIGDAPSLIGGGTAGLGIRGAAIVFGTGGIGYHYLTNDYALFSTQSGAVNLSSGIPASAVLEARSTTKGFLPPRGTNTQMLAIASPATGLMFYDTTNNKLNCYDGTTWQACW
jgi:hypothetical protein